MATGITTGGSSGGSTGDTDMATQDTARGGSGPTTLIADGLPGNVRMNGRGEQLVAAAQTERSEIVRLANSWHASIPTGSAFSTVAAVPTTRAELVLSNIATSASNTCLVIDEVWFLAIVTETAASAYSICVQMSPATLVAVAADNTAVLQRNLSGKSGTRSSNASLALANTAFAVASQWHYPTQQTNGTNLAAVGVGAQSSCKLNGLYVVRPGATFCMNVVVGTAVASAGIMGVIWHEIVLDLG